MSDIRIRNLQKILNEMSDNNNITNFGKLIEFYLSTGYSEIIPLELVQDSTLNNLVSSFITNNKEKYFDNIITNGYLTHSFNGYMLEHYQKNGIGSQISDSELIANFTILENYLGRSKYINRQPEEIPSFYVTSPGNNSLYYALKQSPERLWLGPLSQRDYDNPVLPIVGETKVDYAMRIIENKIKELNLDAKSAFKVLKAGKIVVDKLCTTNSIIAFVPIKFLLDSYIVRSGFFSYKTGKISKEFLEKNNCSKLLVYLKSLKYINYENKLVNNTFFCKNYGGDWDESKLDDICIINTIIPFEKVETLEVEDSFTVCQKILKSYGFEEGMQFDFNKVLLTYYLYGPPQDKKTFELYLNSKIQLSRK